VDFAGCAVKRVFILAHDIARQRAAQALREAPEGYAVTIGEVTRNLEQNAAQWPILRAYADQKPLLVNGVWEYVSKEEWKDVLTGAHKDELARVANYRGRMVILGKRTSKFGKGEFSDWLDWLNAAAVEDDVDLELEAA
jgi:hypothetical protein